MITASQLDRHCGYKRVLGGKRTRTPRQQAALDKGTEFHEWLPRVLAGASPDVEVTRDVASWLVTAKESIKLPPGESWEAPLGLSEGGRYVAVEEPSPHAYRPLDDSKSLLTAGRADVNWNEEGVSTVLDIKTGRFRVDTAERNLQVTSLALAVADRDGSDRYRCGIYYARTGETDWSRAIHLESEAAAKAWGEVEAAAKLDESPRPGPWCQACWEREACEFKGE